MAQGNLGRGDANMTISDGNHEVAKIIKDLEERIADLEEGGDDDSTPQPIRTYYESVLVADSIAAITETQLDVAYWGDENSGWSTSSWGDGDYSGSPTWTTVDSFEDGDGSDWGGYGWSIDDALAYDGQYSALITDDWGNLVKTDHPFEHEDPPLRLVFQWPAGETVGGFQFTFADSSDNRYYVLITDTMELYHHDKVDGTYSQLDTEPVSIVADQWYELVIDFGFWNSTEVGATVTDLSDGTETSVDSDYRPVDPGSWQILKNDAGGSVRADYIQQMETY